MSEQQISETGAGSTGPFFAESGSSPPKKRDRKAYMKAWYEANRERVAARTKAQREACPERVAARDRAYRARHREREAARTKAWREANREREAARRKARREASREYEAAYKKKWREANRGHAASYDARARARRLGAPYEPYTPEQTAVILFEQGGACLECGRAISLAPWGPAEGLKRHLDHVTPMSKGGANALWNLSWLCEPCNRSFGSKHKPAALLKKHAETNPWAKARISERS